MNIELEVSETEWEVMGQGTVVEARILRSPKKESQWGKKKCMSLESFVLFLLRT